MSHASFRNQMERLAKLPPAKQHPLIRLFAMLIEAAEAGKAARAERAKAARAASAAAAADAAAAAGDRDAGDAQPS